MLRIELLLKYYTFYIFFIKGPFFVVSLMAPNFCGQALGEILDLHMLGLADVSSSSQGDVIGHIQLWTHFTCLLQLTVQNVNVHPFYP